MTAGPWEAVNTALYNLLATLAGDGLRLGTVSNWPNPSPGTYPHTFPLPQRSTEADYDTQGNLKVVKFIIRTEFPEAKDEQTHIDMLKTADAIEAELRKKSHAQLGGAVHMFTVSENGQFARTGEGESELIVYDIVVSAELLKDI